MDILTRWSALARGIDAYPEAGGLVSWPAVCVVAGLAAWIVSRETRRPLYGLASAGLLLVGRGLAQRAGDPVLSVMLMVTLTLTALAALRFAPGTRGALIAALLLSAAFLVDPLALPFGIAACGHLWTTDRTRLGRFAPALALGCAGAILGIGPWLAPRLGALGFTPPPGPLDFSIGRAHEYVGHAVFGRFGLLALPALLALAPATPLAGRPEALWWWAGLGALCSGLIGTFAGCADARILLPTLGALVVLGPVATDRLARSLPRNSARATGLTIAVALALQAVALIPPARRGASPPVPDRARTEGPVDQGLSAARR